MLRFLRQIVILVLAALALLALVPPRPRRVPPLADGISPDVRGAIHVHTARSDGTGSIDDVTRAAARAGLQFVIVSDHGDGTRAPDTPAYINGVLYVDALEISTDDGHLVALGLPQAPYPLRGEARDVLDDVSRLGGFSIAAHPGSPKPELQWGEWNTRVGGLEWLNADSEWRDERWWTLARALLVYPFRPPQALALLLDRPDSVLARWDALTQRGRVVGVAAADAHARVGLRTVGEPYVGTGSLHFPPYEHVFREFSISVPDLHLTDDAVSDARMLLEAIQGGHVYSTIDALAGPARLRFTAADRSGSAAMGDILPLDGPVTLRIEAQAPRDARVTLIRNGASIAAAEGMVLEHTAPAEAGVFRVEVTLPQQPGVPPVPWMVSNPIYVGRPAVGRLSETPAPVRESFTLYDGGPPRDWAIEKSAASDAAINVVQTLGAPQLLLRFALSGTPSDHPYVAFVLPATPAVASHERLVVTARADRPMRVSVQLRASGGTDGRRWGRSIYLEQEPRRVEVALSDFRSVGAEATPPTLSDIQSLLFVVDAVNTKIGSAGQIWISGVRYTK